MECNAPNPIIQSDFDCIGNVAQHCDLQKLCIAIDEAKLYDVIPLFCYEFVQDIIDNWDIEREIEDPANPGNMILNSDFEKYQKLICGGEYRDCNNNLKYNIGLKKIWVYFAYAKYLTLNSFNDSPNGNVIKQNDWSIPTPLKDVNTFATKYRNMAFEAYESLLGFLCSSKEIYPLFDDCKCKLSCGCEGTCSCGKTKKITGFRFKTIRK